MAGLDDQPNIKPAFDQKCGLTEAEKRNIVDRQSVIGGLSGGGAGVAALGLPGGIVGAVVGDVVGHRLGEDMAAKEQARLERQPGCPKAP